MQTFPYFKNIKIENETIRFNKNNITFIFPITRYSFNGLQ